MDVAALGSEPVGYLIGNLRCDRKSREVGASVRIYLVPVLERTGAAACNSETAFPVEAMHPHVGFRILDSRLSDFLAYYSTLELGMQAIFALKSGH